MDAAAEVTKLWPNPNEIRNHIAIARHALSPSKIPLNSHARRLHIKASLRPWNHTQHHTERLPVLGHRIFNAKMSTTSPVIAGPITDHCAQGVKHTGEPVGRVETIAGVETYISDPPAGTPGPKKVLLYFADVFSPLFINAKLLQDYFASHGM